MNQARPGETSCQSLARNMSAPPRSTFTFQPYGTAAGDSPLAPMRPAGLAWCLRVSPDVLLGAHVRPVARVLAKLRRQVLDRNRAQDPTGATACVAEQRRQRLLGLLMLVGRLTGEAVAHHDAPLETLLDRLVDLAPRLPRPELPAMGMVEPSEIPGDVPRPATTDPVAGLWLLTHVNGRAFDRDGPAMLPANLAEGGSLDLYSY